MVSIALNLPEEITANEAQVLLAIKLLEMHRISVGTAAELAGYTKPAFLEILSRYEVAVFDYPAGDLENELKL